MAFVHGKNTYISLDGDNLSTFTKSSELARKAKAEDVTTYGKNSMVYSGGLLDGTAKMDGIYDSTAGTGPRAVIEPLIGQVVTLVRRPEGTGTGKPQDTADVVVVGYTETNPVAGMVTWSCELQISDDVDTTAQS